jgi:hypothetical protein
LLKSIYNGLDVGIHSSLVFALYAICSPNGTEIHERKGDNSYVKDAPKNKIDKNVRSIDLTIQQIRSVRETLLVVSLPPYLCFYLMHKASLDSEK